MILHDWITNALTRWFTSIVQSQFAKDLIAQEMPSVPLSQLETKLPIEPKACC